MTIYKTKIEQLRDKLGENSTRIDTPFVSYSANINDIIDEALGSSSDIETKLDTEITDRINGDELLQTQINSIVSSGVNISVESGNIIEAKTDGIYAPIFDDSSIQTDIQTINTSITTINTTLDTKVDKVSGKGLSTEDYTTEEKTKLSSIENYDDTEVKQNITDLESEITNIVTSIDGKVDKVVGKQLSTEDYTTIEKTKLDSLENYDDTEVKQDITDLETSILLKANITDVYNKIESDGKYLISTPNTVYVNIASTKTIEDGSLNYPFKTIQGGIDAADFGSNIIVSPGEYDEDITLNNKDNLTITSEGTIGQFRTVITGNLVISGTSKRIGINNLQFNGTYQCSTPSGLIYFDNIAIGGIVTLSGSGYHQYDDCQIIGSLSVDNNTFLSLRTCGVEDLSVLSVINANATLHLRDVTNVTVNRTIGNLIIDGSTNLVTIPSNPTFSTYPLVSSNSVGFIALNDGSTRASDGTLKPINLQGTTLYSLGKFEFEPSTSNLIGTRVDSGLHSLQIYDHNIRDGYSKINDKLDGHLDGISNKLEELSEIYVPKNNSFTLLQTNWDNITNQYVLNGLTIPDINLLELSLPTFTTHNNKDLFVGADIVCISGDETSITFECKILPTQDIIINLRY